MRKPRISASDAFVYALLDPETFIVRYIGKTVRCPERRLRQHLAECCKTRINRRLNWLRSLSAAPVLAVLETSSREQVAKREMYWIALFRAYGFDLVNATDGGEGAINPSPATLEKRRLKMSGSNNPNFGKPMPEWQRRRLSEARKGTFGTKESKNHQRKAVRTNNVTGTPGVHIRRLKSGIRYYADIMFDGVRYALGTFKTYEEAQAARNQAENSLVAPVKRALRSANTSGAPGVSWSYHKRKYLVYLTLDGKRVWLKNHKTFEGAVRERAAALTELEKTGTITCRKHYKVNNLNNSLA